MSLANSALLFQAVPELNVPFSTYIHAVYSRTICSSICFCFECMHVFYVSELRTAVFHLLLLQNNVINSYRYIVAIEPGVLYSIESCCSFLSKFLLHFLLKLVRNSLELQLMQLFPEHLRFWNFHRFVQNDYLVKFNICLISALCISSDLMLFNLLLWNPTVPLFLFPSL